MSKSTTSAQPRRLDQVNQGERVRVKSLDGDDAIARRLASFGFWPETEVAVIRYAPLGDPKWILRQ